MKEKAVCVVGLGYVGSPLPKPLVIENKPGENLCNLVVIKDEHEQGRD